MIEKLAETYIKPAETERFRVPSRRLAREIVLKVAYAVEVRGCDPEEALSDVLITGGNLPPAYSVRLLTHIERYQEQLDKQLHQVQVHVDAAAQRHCKFPINTCINSDFIVA